MSKSFAMYSGAFLLIVSVIAIGYQPPERITASASVADPTSRPETAGRTVSVDEVLATSVAANIAEAANLPIASNVANLSQSLSAESVLAENDSNIVTKPQIVEASADSRSIQTYTAKAGDTVQKVADRYGVSVSTIKWANNLGSDAIEGGRKLKVLPVDGVLHKVSRGDTVDSIAQRYGANRAQLVAFNDLELGGLSSGAEIIVPNGDLPEDQRPGYVAPAPAAATTPATTGNAGLNYGAYSGGSGSANNYSASVGNRYAFGNCTWYAYERRAQLGRPIGSFWGNASTWAINGQMAGFTVNGTPAPGAIMQNGGGFGHVAIVESVNPGVSVTISEMNGYRFGGGFNRIGTGNISWGEATSGMYRYIH